ncbi:MAG: hypothetical protein J6V66_00675 [Clostridia bacterium]|nr:hypothetical protein [Clostridia bacterium]
MIAHCFFEQSGTFKNEFKKLGIEAYDYDILNDFGEKDFQIDLFLEIEKAYGGRSLFDNIKKDDLIFAFFPCIRFENQAELLFRGTMSSIAKWTDEKKLEYDLKLHKELSRLYELITKMTIICLQRNLKLIIENPYSSTHYLTKYWAIPSTVIDLDRTKRGDKFVKPTQYWFINCKPKSNFVLEPITNNKYHKDVNHCNSAVERSLIHPDYARRFIKEFIL